MNARLIDRALDRLSRRLVRNIPSCTLWRCEPMQRGCEIFVQRNCFGQIVGAYSMVVWQYRLGPLCISEHLVRHYPEGGWSWRRMIEIMVRGG